MDGNEHHFLNEYIFFSLFVFYSTNEIQIGKGEMRVENQELAPLPSPPHYLTSS
jgi:hypothetical protein